MRVLTAAIPFALMLGYALWIVRGVQLHGRDRRGLGWWLAWILVPLFVINAAVYALFTFLG